MPSRDTPRVGYVLKMYPRLAETFILNEILAHEAAGLEMEIFSLRAPIDGRFHGDLGRVRAKATYLGGPSVKAEDLWRTVNRARETFPGGPRIFEFADTETAADLYQGIHLANAVRESGVTHLHAHFATAATSVTRIASRLTGVPYSFTAHAKDIFHESVEDDDFRRKLRDAVSCVTVSDFNLDYLRDRHGEDAGNVTRLYNGLDLSAFSYEPPEARPPLVIGVGRLVDKKGFADLIDACALLLERGREIRCDIVGDGILREKLAAHVESRGVGTHVRLLGARPREEVIERVRGAAVLAAPCVISSNGNRDGLPTVLLEAMALGTPCVSTDVTGIPELVRHDDTGLMAVQHDAESLATELARVLDDPALGRRLADNGRRLVEAEYDIVRNTPVLRGIFSHESASVPEPALEVG